MSSLVEAGLRRVLAEADDHCANKTLPPLPSWHGGCSRVNIADREALDQVLNAERDEQLFGVGRAETPEK